MTIKEYYENYKVNCNYTNAKGESVLIDGTASTIDEFYDNCISGHILPKSNVLAWHKMFMDYCERDDAIFWVRYYESCSKKQKIANGNVWITRRACLTRFEDNFSYVFVSNYEAHEIMNMVRLIDDPNVDEFAQMMNDFSFPMHFESGPSCEEHDINRYNTKVGTVRGGILTKGHWYLAHINGIKSKFLRSDGTVKDIDQSERDRIFPRGNKSEWIANAVTGKKERLLGYSLTNDEKELVKAHFLRFVDPLNYYVTPGPKHEQNVVCARIGEFEPLNQYMFEKYESIYGKNSIDEFKKHAQIATQTSNIDGTVQINIVYSASKKANGTKTIKQSSGSQKTKNTGLPYDKKIGVAYYFLTNKDSLVKVEDKYLNVQGKKGWIAKKILDELGISNDKKGLLIGTSIDDAITGESGVLENTLRDIKRIYNL